MNAVIKLSAPAVHGFWEIPILYEDAGLLALDKPADLPALPDHTEPDRPSLIKLLHDAIKRGAPAVTAGGRTYLMPTHRLDADASGILLLAKSKPVLVALLDLFGAEKPGRRYVALVRGTPMEDQFQVETKLAPHPARIGLMRVDPKHGKRSLTVFTVRERFARHTLLQCEPMTDRPHQIRAQLCDARLPVVGDQLYGGKPLWLSGLKQGYRLKPNKTERPLLARTALHLETLKKK